MNFHDLDKILQELQRSFKIFFQYHAKIIEDHAKIMPRSLKDPARSYMDVSKMFNLCWHVLQTKVCKEAKSLPQLDIFKVLIKDVNKQTVSSFQDILDSVKNFSPAQKHLISEVITVCTLLLVNPATSATGERMFSMARRVKTWLRANMQQQRFNNIALLHCHKERTDRLRLIDVAKEFIDRNDNRKRNFGDFMREAL